MQWNTVPFNTSTGFTPNTSVTVSGLLAATSYNFRVFAENALGSSDPGSIGTFATVIGPPVQMAAPNYTAVDSTHINVSAVPAPFRCVTSTEAFML